MSDEIKQRIAALNRYNGYEIMWAQDGHALIPSPDGAYVLYEDLRASLEDVDATALDRLSGRVAVSEEAKAIFADWFRKNYPGPDTTIYRPDWHAPKILRAAAHALNAKGALVDSQSNGKGIE